MMDFFEKLMLAKQLSFTEGRIDLLGQRFVIAPSDSLATFIYKINANAKLVGRLYSIAKQAVKNGFGANVGHTYSFSFWNYYEWFLDIAKLGGWGIINFSMKIVCHSNMITNFFAFGTII